MRLFNSLLVLSFIYTICLPTPTSASVVNSAASSNSASANSISSLKTLFKAQAYSDVVKAIEMLDKSQRSPEHYSLYVYSLVNIDLEDAEDAIEQGISQYPNNPEVYLVHASIMGTQAQDSIFSALSYAEKALNSLLKAVELAPDMPKYRMGLMSFYLAAPGIAGGDPELALEQARAIGEIDKLKGIVAMSNYYQATEQSNEALAIINAAFETFPNNASLLNQVADIHNRNENYEDAILTYLKITQADKLNSVDSGKHSMPLDEETENRLLRVLNSHYQIGRLALLSNTNLDLGISNIEQFLKHIDNTPVNTNNLPSKQWAKLRLAGLQLANNMVVDAKATFESVALNKTDSNMKSVHKKLNKQIKKAIKKLA